MTLNGNEEPLYVHKKDEVWLNCGANIGDTVFQYFANGYNADIEGNELELLKALKKIIVRDRPVLAICAYHKRSDLIDLPEYLDSIVKDYSFVLRKYAGWTVAHCEGTELVLYAIPFERRIYELEK